MDKEQENIFYNNKHNMEKTDFQKWKMLTQNEDQEDEFEGIILNLAWEKVKLIKTNEGQIEKT